MKKILALILAVLLIVAMAIPAYAVTPELGVPDVPQISDIEFDIKIELPDDVFDDYIPDIDIDVEVPEEEHKPDYPAMIEALKKWFEIFKGMNRHG